MGAGISGLACAYRLRQLGVQCRVFEAGDRAGGVVATVRRNGCLFELGPQFPRFPASVMQLVHELGLDSEFIAGDRKAKRYIFRNGRLQTAPFSPANLLTTKLVGLRSKMRILTEVFRSSKPPSREETLAEFVERKFGRDVLENLVDPVIATIFFGDARKMGMESAFPALVEWEREYGSLVRGAWKTRNARRSKGEAEGGITRNRHKTKSGSMTITDAFPSMGTFASGMGRLPERLAERLHKEIRYGVRIAKIAAIRRSEDNSSRGWQIELSDGDRIASEHLIFGVPAYVVGELLEHEWARLADHLKAIEYSPMCGVSCTYDRSKVANRLDGFGFMVPRAERMRTICTFWNSSLFPKRAPEGKVLMTSFAEPEAEGDTSIKSTEQLARAVERENRKILGIEGEPADREIWTHPRALPQYNLGHAKRVIAIGEILRGIPGLHLAGNYLKGRSIGECVELAFRVADEVHSQLRLQNIQASKLSV